MDVTAMSREQWEKIFDRWYRHVFKVGVFGAGGPSREVVEQCYGLGVSPGEAVHWLKRRSVESCCEG